MALLEEDLVLFVVNLENLLKQSIELVGIGRGPGAGEGGVSVHHGGGGKGVATKLNGLAKCIAPELVLAGVKGEGRRAHGELERGEGEREREREAKKSNIHGNQLHIYVNSKTYVHTYIHVLQIKTTTYQKAGNTNTVTKCINAARNSTTL